MTPELLKTAELAKEAIIRAGYRPVHPVNIKLDRRLSPVVDPSVPGSFIPTTWVTSAEQLKKQFSTAPRALAGGVNFSKSFPNGWQNIRAFGKNLGKIGGEIASSAGKVLGNLFSPWWNIAMAGSDAYRTLGDVFTPKAMGKFSSIKLDNRSNHMRTLKDILVEKIAESKRRRATKAAKVTVDSSDVAFFNKLADAGIEKLAGKWSPWMRDMSEAIIPGIQLASLSGLGMMGASILYDRVADYIKRNSAYNQMFKEFPELNEVPRGQVDKFWTILTDFAPKLATNPLVAGQFISHMIDQGNRGIEHHLAGQLMQIDQSNRNKDIFDLLANVGLKSMDIGGRAMDIGAKAFVDSIN